MGSFLIIDDPKVLTFSYKHHTMSITHGIIDWLLSRIILIVKLLAMSLTIMNHGIKLNNNIAIYKFN